MPVVLNFEMQTVVTRAVIESLSGPRLHSIARLYMGVRSSVAVRLCASIRGRLIPKTMAGYRVMFTCNLTVNCCVRLL
jgi:hypothetical protein